MEQEEQKFDFDTMKKTGFPLNEQTRKMLEEMLDRTKKKIERFKEDEESNGE